MISKFWKNGDRFEDKVQGVDHKGLMVDTECNDKQVEMIVVNRDETDATRRDARGQHKKGWHKDGWHKRSDTR